MAKNKQNFQSIKSTTKDDYSNLASLYRLRLRLNEIEGNKEEIERDEAKILECLDKSLPF